PEIISRQQEFLRLVKEHAELSDIVKTYQEYKKVVKEIQESTALLKEEVDKEMKEMAASELTDLEFKKNKLEQDLKSLLLPENPNDKKNIILEIRAGTGGEEASLFASDLFKMYLGYAQKQGWKVEVMSSSMTGKGGLKEIIAMIEGKGVYSKLKFESGIHRVQRVPETEASGRIHTSAATVAILPEAEELDVVIDQKDVRVDVFRSGGHGGQSVNTTDSAVRVTHIPTGIVVSMQDEKSQHKNKDKAFKILRARLKEKQEREQMDERARERKNQVGSGDRSEKIRTYNFPQNRVTDHRIGLTLHKLDFILKGDLQEIIDGLIIAHQTEALKNSEALTTFKV
ncbi:MAG: peptide chain release factor 1, partial [Nitrospinae bacterium]|nr:peptide chain release factor 1 [Nitrospinota bacterium]